ncbi:MAG: hypothetical protein ABI616_07965 [Pseudomonadota bacterium]
MRVTGQGKVLLWVSTIVLAAVALFVAGKRVRNDDPVILQSYEVPQEIASELQLTLTTALRRGANDALALGQVTLAPNGHLLVTAPVSVQAGVRKIIGEIAEAKPVPTPTIGFDAWIVTAGPGNNARVSNALAEIEPALAVIRKTKGPVSFTLIEKLSTEGLSGHEASQVRGALSNMQIQATLRKGEGNKQVVAAKVRLSVDVRPGSAVALEAQTEMRPGELLIVGQSAVLDPRDGKTADAQVYYIVRATL